MNILRKKKRFTNAMNTANDRDQDVSDGRSTNPPTPTPIRRLIDGIEVMGWEILLSIEVFSPPGPL